MKNTVMQSSTPHVCSGNQPECKGEERKSVANRDRCISNKDRKRSLKPVTHEKIVPTKHSNYYEVLSDVPCAKDDEFWYHDEISLDQKAVRIMKKKDRRIAATMRPKYICKNLKLEVATMIRDWPELETQVRFDTDDEIEVVLLAPPTFESEDDVWIPLTAADFEQHTQADIPELAIMSWNTLKKFSDMIPPEMKTVSAMLFDVYAVIDTLVSAGNWKQFLLRLYLGVKVLWKDASMDLVLEMWRSISMHWDGSEQFLPLTDVDFETQADDGNAWRSFHNQLSTVWNGGLDMVMSPSMGVCVDLVSLLVFTGILGEGATKMFKDDNYGIFKNHVMKEIGSLPDMFSVLIRVTIFISDVVATYIEDGVVDFLGWRYGSKKEMFIQYAHLMNEAGDAIGRRLNDKGRSEKAHFRSQTAYSDALADVIDGLNHSIKKVKPNEKAMYTKMLKDTLQIRTDMTEFQRSSSARVKPYTFSVCGVTSSMKSTVCQAVWRQIAASNGIDTDMTNCTTVNFKDEYFSEIKAQEVLIMDDFMNTKQGAEKSKVTPIRILLDWSSNVSVQIPGAGIPDKGKRYCNAKILGLTCHSKSFHAEVESYQPEAAYRRVEIYIETHLRPEFRAPSGQPDFARIPPSNFPDIWDFHLFTVKIQGTEWSFDRVGGPTKVFNNQELMAYIRDDSQLHFERQRALTDRINTSQWICEHGCVTDGCLICTAPSPVRVGVVQVITMEQCVDRLAINLRGMRRRIRDQVLTGCWDFVSKIPTLEEAYQYLEEYCALIRADAESVHYQVLDAEWAAKYPAELDTQAWEDEIEIHRMSLTQTIFLVHTDRMLSDPEVDPITRDTMSWLSTRRLSARLDVHIHLDCVIIYVEHDPYDDALDIDLNTQAMMDIVEFHKHADIDWYYNPDRARRYPIAETPWSFYKREAPLRGSNTILGSFRDWIADYICDHQYQRPALKNALMLTAWNIFAGCKHIPVAIVGVASLCAAGSWLCTMNTMHSIFPWYTGFWEHSKYLCLERIKNIWNRIWNVDETVNRSFDWLFSPRKRFEMYFRGTPFLPVDVMAQIAEYAHRPMPSMFDIVFRRYKPQAIFAVKAAAIGTACLAVWQLWREFQAFNPVVFCHGYTDIYTQHIRPQPPSSQADPGLIEAIPGEQKDCWLKVAPPSLSIREASRTSTPQVLQDKLEKNLVYCCVSWLEGEEQKRAKCHALSPGGNDWIIPAHIFVNDAVDFHFLSLSSEGIGPNLNGTFCRDDIRPIGATDFVLVRVRCGSLRGCIMDFFPEKACPGVFASLACSADGKLLWSDKRRMPAEIERMIKHKGENYKTLKLFLLSDYPVVTTTGLCGAVWLGNPVSKPFIHSLHICGQGGTKHGGSEAILYHALVTARDSLNEQSGLQPVSAEPYISDLFGELDTQGVIPTASAHHPIFFIEPTDVVPVADIIGTHNQHSGKLSQDIIPSLIASQLESLLGWEQMYKPVPHPNSSRHLRHGLEEILHPRSNFKASILQRALADQTEYIMSYVREIPDLQRAVKVLVDEVVVSGQDGVLAIDKINPHTSAGYPERGAKSRFLVPGKQYSCITESMNYDQSHLDRIKVMEEMLSQGKRIYAPFTLSIKIEPTKMAKEFGRLFGACNMCFTFIFRKYFLSIFRLIQLNPYRFGTALGINCHSADWDELAKCMEWKDRIIEGDYQTYDKTMSADIILATFTILIKIAKEAGYDEKQLRIMNGIAHEVAFPTYEARGLLFVAGGSNPSGHPGTFIINSLACSLYARYCYFLSADALQIELKHPFNYYVHEITAGDDHLLSVHPDCTWFDQHVMQKSLATVGVGYTDGKKNINIPTPFIHLHDASFVSRGFRYCEYMGRYVGPLAVKSLKKSYMIHSFPKKRTVHPPELISTVVEQNLSELFFHGEEFYNHHDKLIRQAMVNEGLSSFNPPLLTWKEMGTILQTRTTPGFKADLTESELYNHLPKVLIGIQQDLAYPEITDADYVESVGRVDG